MNAKLEGTVQRLYLHERSVWSLCWKIRDKTRWLYDDLKIVISSTDISDLSDYSCISESQHNQQMLFTQTDTLSLSSLFGSEY